MTASALVIAALISCAGCSSTSGTAIRVRVANTGHAALSDVVVTFPSDTVTYGDIPVGGASDYRSIKQAYGFAYIKATVDGHQSSLQPTDYVGEELLAPGDYTYGLTATRFTPAQIGLDLRLHRD